MKKLSAFLACSLLCTTVWADITVGVSLSMTGPGASLGIPQRNTMALLPTEVAGQKINYIVLDDATDSTAAARNARRFVEENRVDLIIGSTTVPASSAAAQVARDNRTPQIALAPYSPEGETRSWVFTIAQTNDLMAGALFEHMQADKVKSLGYIGYSDTWGDDWYNVLNNRASDVGYELTSNERFNRTDASVAGQVLRLIRTRPDAVLIGATGTPAALPHSELRRLGFKGTIYHTHGAATQTFLRIGGKDVEGAIMPVGPVVVWSGLDESHPSKAVASDYARLYEAQHGEGSLSPFGAYLLDAVLLFTSAAPKALESAQPGTAAFREALRTALENSSGVVGAHGVYNMSADDHFGHDERSRTLIEVANQDWKVIQTNTSN